MPDLTEHKRKYKQAILNGTVQSDNPLNLLRTNWVVWSKIFNHVDDWMTWMSSHVNESVPAYKQVTRWYQMEFPEPSGININMMPIKLYDLDHSLPDYLSQYSSLIQTCRPINLKYIEHYGQQYLCPEYDPNKIVYLTIHESYVPPQTSQRRPGIHIERPGSICEGSRLILKDFKNIEFESLAWGLGHWHDDIPVDGIYFATNVSGSCNIWPNLIDNPHEVTDAHGGVESLRPYLGPGIPIEANKLYWMTDRTPHESMPIEQGANRQFLRLVVGRISAWYSQHNTPNPMGTQPDAPIIDTDKFQTGVV